MRWFIYVIVNPLLARVADSPNNQASLKFETLLLVLTGDYKD